MKQHVITLILALALLLGLLSGCDSGESRPTLTPRPPRRQRRGRSGHPSPMRLRRGTGRRSWSPSPTAGTPPPAG